MVGSGLAGANCFCEIVIDSASRLAGANCFCEIVIDSASRLAGANHFLEIVIGFPENPSHFEIPRWLAPTMFEKL